MTLHDCVFSWWIFYFFFYQRNVRNRVLFRFTVQDVVPFSRRRKPGRGSAPYNRDVQKKRRKENDRPGDQKTLNVGNSR